MKRWTLYALTAVCAGIAFCLLPKDASSQSAGSFVALQAATPGTAQSGNFNITGTAQMSGFRLTTSPTAGYVLTSDATGIGTWQILPGGGGGLTLPYAATVSNAGTLFALTNSGTGPAISGRHSTTGSLGVLGTNGIGVSGTGGIGVLGAGTTGLRGETAAGGNGVVGVNTGANTSGLLGTPLVGVSATNTPGNTSASLAAALWGAEGIDGTSGNYGRLGTGAEGILAVHGATGNNASLATGGLGAIGTHVATGNRGEIGSAAEGVRGLHGPSLNTGLLASALEGARGTHAVSGNVGRLGTPTEGVRGVHGASGNNANLGTAAEGAIGTHAGTGNNGRLGTATEGARATNANGNFATLGTAGFGARGENVASAHWGSLGSASNGTQGVNANGNFGLLGNTTYGTYGGQVGNVNYGGLGAPPYGAFGANLATGNFGMLGDPMYGGYGFSSSVGGAGLWGNSIANFGVLGITTSDFHGVSGENTTSVMMGASGVRALGNGALGPGAPNAAAVRIENGGVTVAGPIATRPAGSILVDTPWIPIRSCPDGCPDCIHSHVIGYYTDVPLLNDLIIPGPPNVGSIITATVESDPGPPPACTASYVQVWGKMPGTCTFRVARMGDEGDCRPPSEVLYVHYKIFNPLPLDAMARKQNRDAIRKNLNRPKPMNINAK